MFDPETIASDMERIFARADGNDANKPRSRAMVVHLREPIPITAEPEPQRRSRRGLVALACCAGLVLVLIGAFVAYAIETRKVAGVANGAAAPVAARSSSRPVQAPPSDVPRLDGNATAYSVATAPRPIPARGSHLARRRVGKRPAGGASIAATLAGEALDSTFAEDAAITRRLNQAAIDGTRPTLGYAPSVIEAAPR